MLAKKHEEIRSANLFYVFVDLNVESKKPDFYVVPSSAVADYVRVTYRKWLSAPSKTGKPRKDSDMRLYEIYDDEEAAKYLGNWELLGLGKPERR